MFINIKKKYPLIQRLLNDSNVSTKIKLFFSTKSVGEDFDPYEKNYTYGNLNPLTIKGYVHDIKPEALVWKQYGLAEVGAKEVLIEEKYVQWFRICNKIEIDGDTYQVYKENVGNRLLIDKRPFKTARIIISKVK
jgi:hypothetical protein